MKMKLLKAWLRIKLRQWSSAAGLGVIIATVAKQMGYEVPPDLQPYINTIGMGLAGIVLFFMKESGETDAIKDTKHQLEVVAHAPSTALPAAAPAPAPAELRTDGVRGNPPMHPVARDSSPRASESSHGGFNG